MKNSKKVVSSSSSPRAPSAPSKSLSIAKDVKDAIAIVRRALTTILSSDDDAQLKSAFDQLYCIVKGVCLCDTCPGWDRDLDVLYELGRCFVTSNTMQLIKDKHIRDPARWAVVKPWYRKLFRALYEDILPDTPSHASIQQESAFCASPVRNRIIIRMQPPPSPTATLILKADRGDL